MCRLQSKRYLPCCTCLHNTGSMQESLHWSVKGCDRALDCVGPRRQEQAVLEVHLCRENIATSSLAEFVNPWESMAQSRAANLCSIV